MTTEYVLVGIFIAYGIIYLIWSWLHNGDDSKDE